MEQSDSKQYIAFISYKRDDEQAAMWLQEAIESFKLPTELIDRNLHLEEFQKRHVFYLRFSHNGKMLVSIDYDLWNIQDGNPIHAIEEDSMNFKNAKLCTSNKILEHKPLQELITELRDKYHISSIE